MCSHTVSYFLSCSNDKRKHKKIVIQWCEIVLRRNDKVEHEIIATHNDMNGTMRWVWVGWGSWCTTTYLDRRLVSSCCRVWTRVGCFSYVIFSIPVALVSVMLVLVPWKPALEMTPPVPADMFWSTLVWLLTPCPSLASELGVDVMGDARPTPCWIKGLARWFPVWLLVKCWYKLPRAGTDDDDIADGVAGGCWTWLLTIVDTVELLLLLLLLLFVVGNWIPGTVVADDNGTETTRLSGCSCCWRSSFEPPLSFAWMFGVITCDLLFDPLAWEVMRGAAVTCGGATEAVVELAECITFGLTFCMFGSWGGAVAAAGVDAVLKSVRA